MLRPFDSRFSRLKERISRHCEWFEREAAIHQQEMVSRTYMEFRQFLADKEKGDRKEVQAAANARDGRFLKSEWVKMGSGSANTRVQQGDTSCSSGSIVLTISLYSTISTRGFSLGWENCFSSSISTSN